MVRITSEMIRQIMLIADSNLDPNFPPEKLAVFDEQGNLLDLSDIALRLRMSVLSVWKGEWTSGQAYDEGSLIRYNSSLYLATNNVAADGVAPDTPGDTLWAFLAGGGGGSSTGIFDAFKGEWSGLETYEQGDLVSFSGALYIAESHIEPDDVSPNTDGAVIWTLLSEGSGVPNGGFTGQALTKNSDADFDVVWDNPIGGTDVNAMHFRGDWINNMDYTWGDAVIDGGELYVLNAVDTLASFQPAPSSETDPETANWLKIGSLSGGGGGGGTTLLKSYISTSELISDGTAHPTLTGWSRLPTPDQVAFNFTEPTLVRINASFEVRSINTQNASAVVQLADPSLQLAIINNFNFYNNITPEFRRFRIIPTYSGQNWLIGARPNPLSGSMPPDSGISVSWVCEPGPNSLELLFAGPGPIEVRKRMLSVEVIGAL